MSRLNVNINDDTAAALRALADQDKMSVTEVVRRAVSVYKFVKDELDEDTDLQLVNKKSKERTTLALIQ